MFGSCDPLVFDGFMLHQNMFGSRILEETSFAISPLTSNGCDSHSLQNAGESERCHMAGGRIAFDDENRASHNVGSVSHGLRFNRLMLKRRHPL